MNEGLERRIMSGILRKRIRVLYVSCLVASLVMLYYALPVQAQETKKEEKESNKKLDTEQILKQMLSEISKEVKEQAAKPEKTSKSYELEIDGLIIDDSKTKVGRDFYEVFHIHWEPPVGVKGFTIYVEEMAHPQFGSWVWINVDEITVYQTILRPRFDLIESASTEAVDIVSQYLVNRKQDQSEMAGEDLTGTGIY